MAAFKRNHARSAAVPKVKDITTIIPSRLKCGGYAIFTIANKSTPLRLPEDEEVVLMKVAVCGLCKKEFDPSLKQKHNMRNGKDVYCSAECRTSGSSMKRRKVYDSSIVGNTGPVRGVCPICKQQFRAVSKTKTFCSLRCYLKSLQFKTLAATEIVSGVFGTPIALPTGSRLLEKRCRQCEQFFYVKVKERNRKFCSPVCYRAFMADRFDRWIADPQGISLPQCFDEFLNQTTLRCLVEGCDWEGTNLGAHVNFTHGITAEKFKEMVGFNHSTGLIGKELRDYFSEKFKQMHATSDRMHSLPVSPVLPCNRGRRIRLEGKEHSSKSRAILLMEREAGPSKKSVCVACGKEFEQPSVMGTKKYCSVKCRSAFSNRARYELECSHCGSLFVGNQSQKRRSDKNLDVCCSIECRNARNVIIYRRSQSKRMTDVNADQCETKAAN